MDRSVFAELAEFEHVCTQAGIDNPDSFEIWELAGKLGVQDDGPVRVPDTPGVWMDAGTREMIAAQQKALRTGEKPVWRKPARG